MQVLAVKVKLFIPCVQSLKEKRRITKSLIEKTKNRYNVSISEVDNQDYHQTLTLGIAVVTNDLVFSQKILNETIKYIELNEEAEVREIEHYL